MWMLWRRTMFSPEEASCWVSVCLSICLPACQLRRLWAHNIGPYHRIRFSTLIVVVDRGGRSASRWVGLQQQQRGAAEASRGSSGPVVATVGAAAAAARTVPFLRFVAVYSKRQGSCDIPSFATIPFWRPFCRRSGSPTAGWATDGDSEGCHGMD